MLHPLQSSASNLPQGISAPGRRSGFTLIELLAVILIIGILATFLIPKIPFIQERAYITACRANLGEIGKGLLAYQSMFDGMPKEGGAKFFCVLIKQDMIWENTPKSARGLTCPGVDYNALPGLQGLEEEQWYADYESVDGTYTAYAGRDVKEYGFRRKVLSGKEVLVADDNDPENNHKSTTLALMGDWTVREYDMATLKDKKMIDVEEEVLLVGPESPVEELQKLSLD
ncbi:hypothetical protein CMO84_02475 [Candidatus Woesearchaeota archaeon]|nr:hypothetical protein [Candidatus Woesearchaeota archaeon]